MNYLRLSICLFCAGAGIAAQPAFHGNSQHTGYSPVNGPNVSTLKWKLNLGGPIISSPVVGLDGTIYLGSVLNDTNHPEHFITAVNPNGTIHWRYKTGYWDTQTQSSPAVGPDGKIYVGAQDTYFYALNSDGTLAWRFQGNTPIQQHPVAAQDGTVYVGMDGKLVALTSTGVLKWTADLGYNLPGGPALSADENTIYAFGYAPAGPVSTLYAFDRDGALRWRQDGFAPYCPALSAPTIMADGTVLVLSGAITAVNPADGSVKWTYSPSGPYYSSYGSVSVNPSGNVIFAFDRFLGKLQSNGTRVWELEFLGGASANELESTASSPLLDASGNIYLGLGTGKRSTRPWGKVLRAYNAAGGTRWEYTLGEGTYTSAPALGTNGTLYVGCMDGNLYAFGTPDKVAPRLTSPQLTQPAAFTFTLTGEANSIYHIEASDDLVNWTRVLSVTNPTMPAPVTVPTPPGKPCQFWRAVMQ